MDNAIDVDYLYRFLGRMIDLGYDRYTLRVNGEDIAVDSIAVDHLNKKVILRETLCNNKDVQAISNLRSKIDKAYEEFIAERSC